jgi:esterase/lipase
VVGILNIPEKIPAPGIILCHGGSNDKINCPTFPQLWEKLVSEGYIVMRFDFFGSGESDGDFRDKTHSNMFQNIKDALDYFYNNPKVIKDKIGIWGRSQSGAQLSYLVDDRIKCRVLQSPVQNFIDAFGSYYKKDWDLFQNNPNQEYLMITETDLRKVKGPYGYSRQFIDESYKLVDLTNTALPKITHTLFTQGNNDRETNIESTLKLFEIAGDPKEFYIFHGTGHKYEGMEDGSVAIATYWFNKWLKN